MVITGNQINTHFKVTLKVKISFFTLVGGIFYCTVLNKIFVNNILSHESVSSALKISDFIIILLAVEIEIPMPPFGVTEVVIIPAIICCQAFCDDHWRRSVGAASHPPPPRSICAICFEEVFSFAFI